MRLILRLLAAAALALALGGWSKPQQLDKGYVYGFALEGDGHGHRVAGWYNGSEVRVAVAERGRDFGPAQTITNADGAPTDLQIAVGPRGDALVAWRRAYGGEAGEECCSVVHGALVRRDGRVIGPVSLSTPATDARNLFVA